MKRYVQIFKKYASVSLEFFLFYSYAWIQKVLSEGGSNYEVFFCVFLVDGREDPNTTISGPSSAR